MATTTTTKAATVYAMDGDDAPKWRVEHAVSDMATCNQAECKRKGTKISKGELRIGTHTWLHEKEEYYWAWRHWACATKQQIAGLKTISGGEPAKIPGYERISEESREQVKQALEEGKILEKGFKDIRPDLVMFGLYGYDGEIRNAVGYKVEVTTRAAAGCRGAACKQQGIKIAKGELRLGIARLLEGEHESWGYKHWKCISKYDLNTIKERMERFSLDGIDSLPKEFKAAVLQSLEKGEAVEPPKLDLSAPAKKSRAKKKQVDEEDEADAAETGEVDPAKEPGRKKRTSEELDDADEAEEPLPKKTRGGKATTVINDLVGEKEVIVPKKTRGRKAAAVDNAVSRVEEVVPRMTRSRKAAAVDNVVSKAEAAVPRVTRSRKAAAVKKGVVDVEQKGLPKKTRGTRATPAHDLPVDETEPAVPKKTRRQKVAAGDGEPVEKERDRKDPLAKNNLPNESKKSPPKKNHGRKDATTDDYAVKETNVPSGDTLSPRAFQALHHLIAAAQAVPVIPPPQQAYQTIPFAQAFRAAPSRRAAQTVPSFRPHQTKPKHEGITDPTVTNMEALKNFMREHEVTTRPKRY